MFKDELKLMPTKPGCYLMYDDYGVIYVGKAKNLKRRVSSYFNKIQTGKTLKLVNNIKRFEYIVTASEVESLLLEINLIKKYKPKYNILLKDDKSYPYIEITNEAVPRIKITRTNKKTKSRLFGPYPNVAAARQTVNLINRIYPTKKCRVYPKKPCLYYHIDQCLGYCVYKIDPEKIKDMFKEIAKFLNGDASLIKKKLREEINFYSKKQDYEKCIELKEMLNYIDLTLDKQKIEINDNTNRDIIGYYSKDNYLSIQIFFLRRGSLIERKSEIFNILDAPEEEMIRFINMFYYDKEPPKELLIGALDKEILEESLGIRIVKPVKGIKRKLVEMANNNAQIALEKQIDLLKLKEEKLATALIELKQKLNIPSTDRIEIFDNSHLFGKHSVSGMVVFENGQKNPNEYRKYKITSDYKDDYHFMKEVIYRRYFKVLKDKLQRPDLIIVDGGVIQVNAAKEVLESLRMDIPVIGLKKDDKHRTTSIVYDKEVEVNPKSELFFLLTRMQDEVHRYTINYHKKLRSKGFLESELDNIKGLGETRRLRLIEEFETIDNIKKANLEKLEEILPKNVALELYTYFKNNK